MNILCRAIKFSVLPQAQQWLPAWPACFINWCYAYLPSNAATIHLSAKGRGGTNTPPPKAVPPSAILPTLFLYFLASFSSLPPPKRQSRKTFARKRMPLNFLLYSFSSSSLFLCDFLHSDCDGGHENDDADGKKGRGRGGGCKFDSPRAEIQITKCCKSGLTAGADKQSGWMCMYILPPDPLGGREGRAGAISHRKQLPFFLFVCFPTSTDVEGGGCNFSLCALQLSTALTDTVCAFCNINNLPNFLCSCFFFRYPLRERGGGYAFRSHTDAVAAAVVAAAAAATSAA